jgi:tetratricopeptide (TPR) repeat protein
MLLKYFTCLFLSLMLVDSQAQDSTLVVFEKITHLNETEKRVFNALKAGEKVDMLSLIIAINGKDEDKWKAEDMIASFSKDFEKERKKGTEKFVKALHKSLHTNQLRYYQDICTVSETVNGGAYNCVSATAIFALIFEKTGYPYAIHQTPNHVYIVVEPQASNIVVETTTDTKAQFTINEEFKQGYLDYLRKAKLFSPKETAGMTNDQIFNHYYFGDEVISLKQLAGIQYYNDGLLHSEKEAYDEALSQFEKAYLLYPCERFQYLMMFCSAKLLDNATDKTTPAVIANMGKYLKYSDDPGAMEYVEQTFHNSTIKLLLEKADIVAYNAYSEQLLNEVTDPGLDSQLLFTKYLHLSKYYGLKRDFNMTKSFAAKAGKIKPEHLEAKNLLLVSELELLHKLSKSPQVVLDSINAFCAEFPVICDYPELKEMRLNAKLFSIMEAAENEEYERLSEEESFEKMIKFVEEVEPLLTDLNSNPQIELHLVYGEIASHEFRKKNYEAAMNWLRRGLKVFPNNPDLKSRLKNIEEFAKKK